MSEPTLLTMRQVCSRTNFSRATINRWIASGKFPKPNKYGRNIRWLADEIDTWINGSNNHAITAGATMDDIDSADSGLLVEPTIS